MYSPPKGPAGKKFIVVFAAEWKKVRKRKTNSEQALIFPACILRKAKGVSRAKSIKRRVLRRLALWENGQIAELVNDIVNATKQGGGGGKCPDDDDSIARRYHSMVIEGKLREAVRWVTTRDGGGVLHPDNINQKSGKTVAKVLESKYPACIIPNLGQEGWASFEEYEERLNSVPMGCDQDIVQRVADRMKGGAGPSSVDAQAYRLS